MEIRAPGGEQARASWSIGPRGPSGIRVWEGGRCHLFNSASVLQARKLGEGRMAKTYSCTVSLYFSHLAGTHAAKRKV